MISEDCTSNIHEFCNPCDCICHGYNFSREELKALWRILEKEWIPLDDLEAHEVARKIMKIVDARTRNELDKPHSQAT